ncbi:MAG TPA: aldo/keto reductase [Arcobacter sp.]|nr:aldo/keto reductase [Arcobacter sp.]
MKYIKFNGNEISKLSLGTVQFGLNYGIANTNGQPNQEDVNQIIEYVHKEGINSFDTAQAYGNSEEILGNALLNISDSLVISKLKSDLFENNLKENVKISLEKLKINSLFSLLLHDSKLLYEWNDKHKQNMSELIDDKLIKYFGVSVYSSEDFDLAIENDDISIIQVPFNIFDQRAIKLNWFKKAREKNKLIFIRSVFLQGLLLMNKNEIPQNLEHSKKYIEKFEDLCEELHLSKNELALSFVDSVAKDSLLLFGCDNIEQAKENIYNYNALKHLDDSILLRIKNEFSEAPEHIYNPTKW